jgi:hypothetical protein
MIRISEPLESCGRCGTRIAFRFSAGLADRVRPEVSRRRDDSGADCLGSRRPYLRSRLATPLAKAAPLTEKDSVLLADFVNKTGDPAFDDALKQALTIQLSQSPFLNIVSDRKIEETLRLMGQPKLSFTVTSNSCSGTVWRRYDGGRGRLDLTLLR